jgi:hypothetical protein
MTFVNTKKELVKIMFLRIINGNLVLGTECSP